MNNSASLEALQINAEKAFDDYIHALENGQSREEIDQLRSDYKTKNDIYVNASHNA